MAHRAKDLSEAIFSPSVARIAASTARDWSYVDSWLQSKFPNRPVPAFERNPDTLKALLTLASLNEAADEHRHLLARANAAALQELSEQHDQGGETSSVSHDLLDAIEQELPKEGTAALDAMAHLAVRTGAAFPQPQTLGSDMLAAQVSVFEAAQMKARVAVLQRQIHDETAELEVVLRGLESDAYKQPADLAKQNLDLQRRIKASSTQLPELRQRVAVLSASVEADHPTFDDIVQQETAYQGLLVQKKDLDLDLASFRNIPSDPDLARSELDALRRRLQGVSGHRDALFEDLVEQESPAKRR